MNNTNNKTLILKNINKDYQQGRSQIEILKNINLEAKQGELIAIIGASGSGKSTLLHIMGSLDKPNSGEVWINGLLLNDNNKTHIRLSTIGFVYQYHHLLKDFSARENVALPMLIYSGNYQKSLERADFLLNKLGIEDKKYNMPGELSGGEQQRVAIARSLVNLPKIILADEPTGNLDPYNAEEVFELFLNVAQEYKTTIIMVTHNHAMATKMHSTYELKYGTLNKQS
jgi:lipoprotein-releasing system ATP-binding protein